MVGRSLKTKSEHKVAIKVENLSKTFIIPHEKNTSLKSAALGALNFNKKGKDIFKALSDINFEVKQGEFFGIIGRNGSGKSTLLKILAGIYLPDKGEGKVTVNGKLSPFLELGVGFNPELTGRENVYLGGALLGLSRSYIDSKYQDIVGFAELEEFMDMKFKNFSSGMQVRLAFALSINAHAEILLMDEVLAVGDNNFQAKCLREFNSYKEQGKTVVLVSHDINTIQKYCDRAILLDTGKIQKIGKANKIGDDYLEKNIIRESKRREKEAGIVSENEPQNTAKVLSATLFDKSGRKTDRILTNTDVSLHIKYQVNDKKLVLLNFSVGLRSVSDGSLVFGYTTEFDFFDVSVKKKVLTLSLEKLNLVEGNYYINVICYGKDLQDPYDFVSRVVEFRVDKIQGMNRANGLVRFDHKWG